MVNKMKTYPQGNFIIPEDHRERERGREKKTVKKIKAKR